MKTSIHIQPIKPGSERHNNRTKKMGHVRSELSASNEKFILCQVYERLEAIKAKYEAHTGQKMQKKATPIREGVVVIKKDTTMHQLMQFCRRCEEEFGIRAIQIYTHRDEGHFDASEWKPNYHAHIVFDWTDERTGKTIKLNKDHMSLMQTMLASSLDMERGLSSDRNHLGALEWKIAATEHNYPDYNKLRAAIKEFLGITPGNKLTHKIKELLNLEQKKNPSRKRGFRL